MIFSYFYEIFLLFMEFSRFKIEKRGFVCACRHDMLTW